MLEAFLHYGSVFSFITLGIAVVSCLTSIIIVVRIILKNRKNEPETIEKEVEKSSKKRSLDHPVVGYKTANIENISFDNSGEIVDIAFKGLVGTVYSPNDSTEQSGTQKFNMYHDVESALDHQQNWGSVFLEVVGFGGVEEHRLGYTAQNQRVLQVGFLECSYMLVEDSNIKCENYAEYFACSEDDFKRNDADPDSINTGYNVYCAGCVKRYHGAVRLFPYHSSSFVVSDSETGKDNTIVITGQSSREKVDFTPTVINEDN